LRDLANRQTAVTKVNKPKNGDVRSSSLKLFMNKMFH